MAYRILVFLLVVSLATEGYAFVTPARGIGARPVLLCGQAPSHCHSPSICLEARRNLEDEIEEASRRNAKGGMGETAAGAVLGSLLLGPFGAIFGAQLGASLGANNAVNRARREEMSRLGITDEMIASAKDIGRALERAAEGLRASEDSLQTQQNFARRLDDDSKYLYERAKSAMEANNEEEARRLLRQRQNTQEKLKSTLILCAEEKQRKEKMEENVRALEQRALEIETLLNRSVTAKSLQDSNGLMLSEDDPLLQKFRDLGID